MNAEPRKEWAPFALVALLALVLRLHGLPDGPLAPDEATNAAAAWALSGAPGPPRETPGSPGPTSPLLTTCEWVLFGLGGTSDGASRLPTAAFGAALALLPFLVQREMGGPAALALAVLLAAEPVLVAYGRHADGSVASAFFAALALVALWRAQDREAPGSSSDRWPVLAAASAGLLLATGVHAWSFLPLVAIAAVAARDGVDLGGRPLKLAGVVAGAAVVGASALLRAPEMTGGVSASLGLWLRQWAPTEAAAAAPLARLTALARTDGLALVLALVGFAGLWHAGRQRLTAGLALGVAWGFVLALAPSALPSSRIVIVAVAAVAAAWGAAGLKEWMRADRIAALLVAAPLVAITVSLAFRSDAMRHGEKLSPTGPAVASIAASVALLAAWSTGGLRAILRGTALWLVAGLFVLTFRNTGRILESDAPEGLLPPATSPDVRRLVGDLRELGAARRGDPLEVPVTVLGSAGSDPVLAWSLRGMRRVRFVSSVSGGTEGDRGAAIVVAETDADARMTNPPAGYVGTRYALRVGRPGGPRTALWVPSEP